VGKLCSESEWEQGPRIQYAEEMHGEETGRVWNADSSMETRLIHLLPPTPSSAEYLRIRNGGKGSKGSGESQEGWGGKGGLLGRRCSLPVVRHAKTCSASTLILRGASTF
jgi:hypothetical protein